MKRKIKLPLSILLSTSILLLPTPLITSCSQTGIIFANFESYMSSDLMQELHKQTSIRFVSYSTNEDISAKFQNSYDIAVPSTYTVLELIKRGLCGKIDWKYMGETFGLTADKERPNTPESLQLIDNANPKTDQYDPLDPENTNNAQWLFSDTTDGVINSIDEYAHKNGFFPESDSILQYSLPYFLQDWMFAYHGDYIDELPSCTEQGGGLWYSTYDDGTPVTWNDVTNVIAPYLYKNGKFEPNDNQDRRFKPTITPNIAMVDDARSVYDMSHLIYDAQQSGYDPKATGDINPRDNEQTINSIENVYKSFTSKFEPNTFHLNTDSEQVSYIFAKPENKDNPRFGATNGLISYNGDILYATMGEGTDDWADTWNCEPDPETETPLKNGNIHIVKLKNTLIALDMVVINKKINNSSKKADVYKVLYKSILEGANLPAETEEASEDPWIGAENNNDEYTCGPTMNFDFVSYTPTLWNLNTFVSRDEENPNQYNSYFDSLYPESPNKAELLAEINNINFAEGDTNLIELPLSDLTKSRMSKVYLSYREYI